MYIRTKSFNDDNDLSLENLSTDSNYYLIETTTTFTEKNKQIAITDGPKVEMVLNQGKVDYSN